MSDSNVTAYKFRSVVLPFSGLEVVGEDWDEFVANLTIAVGDEALANAYLGMRQFEVRQLVDGARNSATGGSSVSPDQGVRNATTGLGADVLCPGHGEPAKKLQVKKDGPNKNRWFYACARPQNSQCDFFQFV